ncbi:unnamed protein product [Trichobilharzia szidati]|nr:unnamed protein product [Trichobilharzia szidati]
MTEGSSNFGHSTPSANFSNYLANSNQFNNSYNQNCQNPNYPPLFHPAAVAAVAAAAAAAGYTQQFNPGVIGHTLGLTANNNGSNAYLSPSDASRAYYARFALQQSGLYPGSNTFNNFGGMNIPHDFPLSNSTVPSIPSSSSGSGFSLGGGPSNYVQKSENCPNSQQQQQQSAGQSTKPPKSSSSVKGSTKTSGIRNRKSLSSEELANRKHQEFNELVKARTEKLMSDGPVLNMGHPLNLTANSNGLNTFVSSANMNRAYYNNSVLQQSGLYPGSNTFNNFGGMNIPHDFQVSNSTTIPSSTSGSGFSLGSGPSNDVLKPENCSNSQQQQQQSAGQSTKPPKSSSSAKGGTKTSGIRNRKSLSSEELASRKRQEFNELVKARTEKLMSDGPVLNSEQPGQSSTALSSSSSAGSTGPESDTPNYRKLIHAVLDAKKSALLRSPQVIDFLSSRQRALTDYKRQTELFSVTMNK